MSSTQRLILPALRAQMGDWVYYLATVRMSDLASRVNVAADIHTSNSLKELIQRELDTSTHASNIAEYLLKQPQRLFDALVIGVYGGSPKWYELDIRRREGLDIDDLEQYVEGVLGILVFEGNEKLFALDGQHRLVGVQLALEKNLDLGDEEVGAMFVSHKNDAVGMERTRRLFTTLNRYAKPVSPTEIIALDEDDVVAIVTRYLMESHPLFKDKVSLTKGKSISPKDKTNFTGVVTIYDCLDDFLNDKGRKWKKYKKLRPNDQEVDYYQRRAVQLWDSMITHFPAVAQMANAPTDFQVAGQYRTGNGGHILFRPIGLQMYVRTIRRLQNDRVSLDEAMERICKVPTDLVGPPWAELLWNTLGTKMITYFENQRVAAELLYYSVCGNQALQACDEAKLRRDLAGVLNRMPDEIDLPRYVT